LVASRANNEDLRRTNEELRRDLQRMGERTNDERTSPIPVKARPMPFSQEIMDTVIPASFMVPKITFIGVEDPKAHITTFHTQMMISRGTDAMHGKLFMGTFSGTMLDWFISLPDGHITSFESAIHCQQGSPSRLVRSLQRKAIPGRAFERFPEQIRGTGGEVAH